jgi:hypothetical protein
MKKFTKYVGLDVHIDSIALAVADAARGAARFFGDIANAPEAVPPENLAHGEIGIKNQKGHITAALGFYDTEGGIEPTRDCSQWARACPCQL